LNFLSTVSIILHGVVTTAVISVILLTERLGLIFQIMRDLTALESLHSDSLGKWEKCVVAHLHQFDQNDATVFGRRCSMALRALHGRIKYDSLPTSVD